MGFLQIITFGTDRFDEFVALEHEWSAGHRGPPHRRRRAGLRGPRPTGPLRRARLVRLLRVGDGQLPAPRDRRLRTPGGRAHHRRSRVREPRAGVGSVERRRGSSSAPLWSPRAPRRTRSPTTSTSTSWCPTAGCGRRASPRWTSRLRAEAPGRDIEVWNSRSTDRRLRRRVRLPHARHARLVAGLMLATLARRDRRAASPSPARGNWSAETEAGVAAPRPVRSAPRVTEAVR